MNLLPIWSRVWHLVHASYWENNGLTATEEGVACIGNGRKLTNASTRLAPGQNKVTMAEREERKEERMVCLGLVWLGFLLHGGISAFSLSSS